MSLVQRVKESRAERHRGVGGEDDEDESLAHAAGPDDDDDGVGARPPFAAAGACSVGPMFPPGACNGKIATARYFAGGAAAALPLDPSRDLSPFDAEGHGRCALYYNLPEILKNSMEEAV